MARSMSGLIVTGPAVLDPRRRGLAHGAAREIQASIQFAIAHPDVATGGLPAMHRYTAARLRMAGEAAGYLEITDFLHEEADIADPYYRMALDPLIDTLLANWPSFDGETLVALLLQEPSRLIVACGGATWGEEAWDLVSYATLKHCQVLRILDGFGIRVGEAPASPTLGV